VSDLPPASDANKAIAEILEELCEDGLLARSGTFRNGKPVYIVTEKGRKQFLLDEMKCAFCAED
jgi:hypothetical protein